MTRFSAHFSHQAAFGLRALALTTDQTVMDQEDECANVETAADFH